MKKIISAAFILFAVLILPLTSSCQTNSDRKKVELIRTPHEGIQPQAAVDENGVLHLIYFKGAASAGDIYYVKKAPGDKSFSSPIQVNSQAASAIATGSVRGAHIAVGRGGRVHVAWMGSNSAEPKGPAGATPMLYARMNEDRTAFEPQRNVMGFATGLDGGGSLAADRKGNVYVAWHAAGGEAKGDAHRRVWVTISRDDGKTFGREVAATDEALGACGCCGMRAFVGDDDTLYLMYRAATNGVERDMYLVTSQDEGRSYRSERVGPWKLEACPMSTTSIGGQQMVKAAWETDGQIYYTDAGVARRLEGSGRRVVSAPGSALRRKHPGIAVNLRGETLLVWTEKTGWQKGGSVVWQIFDEKGQPTQEKGTAEGVPVWGLIALYAHPDGDFTIIY